MGAVPEPPEGPEGPEGSEEKSRAGTWTRLDLYALAGMTLLAGILRLWRLGEPSRQIFDEQFYAKDACHYATGLFEECRLAGGIIEVHPPMGKWVMAAGIKLFGYNAFGSRIMAVLAGMAIVSLTYLIAKRLLGSTGGASLAAFFVTFDMLHFVHSRLGIIEIFVGLFCALAFLALLYDRDAERARGPGREPSLRRPWLLVAGLAGGATLATKWSGAPILLALVLLTLAWEWSDGRRTDETEENRGGRFRAALPAVIIYLVVVPALVYVGSYIGRIPASPGPWSAGWFAGFWDQQSWMFRYFRHPRPEHAYEAAAWKWLILPADFPYALARAGDRFAEIVAVAHPLFWWPATAALLVSAARWLRAPFTRWNDGFVVVGFLSVYALWLVPSLLGFSHSFIYYLLPAIPFMAVALADLCRRLAASSRGGRRSVAGLVVAVAGFFFFMYPLLAHVFMEPDQWRLRARIYDICPVKYEHWREIQATRVLQEQCRDVGIGG